MAALPIRIRRSGAILGKQAQRIPMFISRTLKIPSGRSAQVTSGLLFDCVTVIKRRHEMMTMKPPIKNMPDRAILCDMVTFKLHRIGNGNMMSTISVTTLGIATASKYVTSLMHTVGISSRIQNPLTGLQEKIPMIIIAIAQAATTAPKRTSGSFVGPILNIRR